MKKKVKLVIILLGIIFCTFIGYKGYVTVSKKIQDNNKIKIRKQEKEECLKKTPWQTLEGITLCDTIWEARKKMGNSGAIKKNFSNDYKYYDLSVDNIDIRADRNGYLIYYIKTIRYDVEPDYKKFFKKFVNINGKSFKILSYSIDYYKNCHVSNDLNKYKYRRERTICYGDCIVYSNECHKSFYHNNEIKAQFRYTYEGSSNTHYLTLQMRNAEVAQENQDYIKRNNQRQKELKAKEF